MTLIKKIDVNEHFAARRRMRMAAVGLARKPAAKGFPVPETGGSKANASDFSKDFSLEHSSHGVPATPSK